jgi:16S rRNA (guanine1207-N2)-methyltransferase
MTWALEDATHPLARLLTAAIEADAARWAMARSWWLQPTVAEPVRRAHALGAAVRVSHRKWPAVQALCEVLATEAVDGMDVVDRDAHRRVAVRHTHGALGWRAVPAPSIVVLTVPEERVAVQQLLLEALTHAPVGARVWLAGANDAGAKPAARLLGSLCPDTRVLAQGGGHRLVEAVVPEGLDLGPLRALVAPYDDTSVFRELSVTLAGAPATLWTRPGVFSWDHLDEATALLAEHLDVRTDDRVLDLGCGAGALALAAWRAQPTAHLTLVDADSEALRCASRTLADVPAAQWRVVASDAGRAVAGESFDLVLSNPPFHAGKRVDLALPRQFLDDAWSVLRPGGRLRLVANRTLPYEAELAHRFGGWRVVHDGPRFKILEALRS